MIRALKTLLKDAFFLTHRRPLGERASILSYYDIGTNPAFFTISPRMLESQLQYLKDSKLSVISLSELIRRLRASESIAGCVVLTFNDGYESLHSTVFPLLKKYSMPASVFVTVEYLDTTIQTSDGHSFRTISMAGVRELLASGLVEFFSQTPHRQRLDGVVLEHATARIDQARGDLESVIGTSAPVFAFPKGKYTHKIVDHLRSRGWQGAVTMTEGLVHKNSDPYLLPRNAIDSRTTFTQFKGKISGAIERYVAMRAN